MQAHPATKQLLAWSEIKNAPIPPERRISLGGQKWKKIRLGSSITSTDMDHSVQDPKECGFVQLKHRGHPYAVIIIWCILIFVGLV